MANLSRDDVLKLARLSRLYLTEPELNEISEEINAILGYVEQLQGADTSDLSPTDQVTGLTNVMRADKTIDYGYEPKSLLSNVSKLKDNQILVKRMVE
jgi:aspartyl-tRNA(Asn)/glutamyl-tRNA(Gln) amidotransferase subunit C